VSDSLIGTSGQAKNVLDLAHHRHARFDRKRIGLDERRPHPGNSFMCSSRAPTMSPALSMLAQLCHRTGVAFEITI